MSMPIRGVDRDMALLKDFKAGNRFLRPLLSSLATTDHIVRRTLRLDIRSGLHPSTDVLNPPDAASAPTYLLELRPRSIKRTIRSMSREDGRGQKGADEGINAIELPNPGIVHRHIVAAPRAFAQAPRNGPPRRPPHRRGPQAARRFQSLHDAAEFP